MNLISSFTNNNCDRIMTGFVGFCDLARVYGCSKGNKEAVLDSLRERYVCGTSREAKKLKIKLTELIQIIPSHHRKNICRIIKDDHHFDALIRLECMICGDSCYNELYEYGFLAHTHCVEKHEVALSRTPISREMANYMSIPQRNPVPKRPVVGRSINVLPYSTRFMAREIPGVFPFEKTLKWYMTDKSEMRVAKDQTERDEYRQTRDNEQRLRRFKYDIKSLVGETHWKWMNSLPVEFREVVDRWDSVEECLKALEIVEEFRFKSKKSRYVLATKGVVNDWEVLTLDILYQRIDEWDRLVSIGRCHDFYPMR